VIKVPILGRGNLGQSWKFWTSTYLWEIYSCLLIPPIRCATSSHNADVAGGLSLIYSMQIVTGIEVIVGNFILHVHKMLPQDRRLRATFYELRRKNFQWWTTCQSIIVLLYLKTKQFYKWTIRKTVTTSMLQLLPSQQSAGHSARRQCIFVNVTWRDFDQSRADISRWGITIRNNKYAVSLVSIGILLCPPLLPLISACVFTVQPAVAMEWNEMPFFLPPQKKHACSNAVSMPVPNYFGCCYCCVHWLLLACDVAEFLLICYAHKNSVACLLMEWFLMLFVFCRSLEKSKPKIEASSGILTKYSHSWCCC